jgi:hypothetical protein
MPALDPAGEVTININLPKLQLPRIKHPREYRKHLPALPYKKLAVSGVVLVVVGAGGLTAFRAISGKYGQDVALGKNKDVTASAGSAAASAGALVPSAKPTYKPVVPKSKPQLADAPADSSAYDAGRGVYSFVDVFNGTQLTVSEQPLPSKYASGEAATAAIAKQMGAKQQVNTAHGTAYIVSATKGSGQTVVVSAGNLLLFIQTAFNHSVYDWNDYINTLE